MIEGLKKGLMGLAALFGRGGGKGALTPAQAEELEAIRKALRRRAVLLEPGGDAASGAFGSWIGGVRWRREGESAPRDAAGGEMIPLASVFLEGLPCLPPALSGLKCLAVFMAADIRDHLVESDLGPWFAIRTADSLEGLLPCDWRSALLTPRPLRPRLVENDFPDWDGDIPPDIEARVQALEEEGLDFYETVCEAPYEVHKVGGYPSFCQAPHSFGDGYEFVMQLVSDEEAGLDIVDAGRFYFYYHPGKKDWKACCDFF